MLICDDQGKPDLQEAFGSWFQGETGQSLLTEEAQVSQRLLAEIYGRYQVSIGFDPEQRLAANSKVMNSYAVCSSIFGAKNDSVVAESHHLPFESDRVDLIILHHALECSSHPHQALREAVRVLKPGGYLMLYSFNPISYWGGVRFFQRLVRRNKMPWCCNSILQSRLSDWLKLLGMNEMQNVSICHGSSLISAVGKLSHKQRWLSVMGRRLWPGSVVCILARKDLHGMTPITPPWRRRGVIKMPIAVPSIRGHLSENR